MTESAVAIIHGGRDFSRTLRLDKSFRDSIADHLKRRWPTNTAKSVAKEYGLTLDRARDVLAGRGSLTTIEAIIKRGGFAVALPLLEEVIGKTLAQHLRELQHEHEAQGARIAQIRRDLLSVAGSRSFAPADDGHLSDSERPSPRSRRAG